MAPRRLFQPRQPRADVQVESLSFAPTPPAAPPPKARLEDEIEALTAEPDRDLRLSKAIRLMHDRGEELRAKWGDDTFDQVVQETRRKVSEAPTYEVAPPGPLERAAPVAAGVLTMPTEALMRLGTPLDAEEQEYLAGPDATAWERAWGSAIDTTAPRPPEEWSHDNALGVAARKTALGAATVLGPALPDLLHAGATMAGTALAGATIGQPPAGPSVGDQAAGLIQPMATAGEIISSAPAMVASKLGNDPSALPGVLARSEDYLRNLALRVGESPAEPVVGGLMAGGLGAGAIAAKRKLFAPRAPAPEVAGLLPPAAEPPPPPPAPPPMLPPGDRGVVLGEGFETRPSMPYTVADRATGEITYERPPINPEPQPRLEAPPPQRALPQGSEPPRLLPPGQSGHVEGDGFSMRNLRPDEAPPKPVPVESPDLTLRDAEEVVRRAPAQPRAVVPGKRRLFGGSPGSASSGRGRGRSGRLVVPTFDQVKRGVRELAEGTGRVIERVIAGPKPRPAPPPGAAGGPGHGAPFTIEPIRADLKPVKASLFTQIKDLLLDPAAAGSWYSRTGITDLAVNVTRIRNTMRSQIESFLWGDGAGRQWLKEEFQKAGPDLWSAVVATREGRKLSPAESAASAKHAKIFNQLTGPGFRFLDYVRSQKLAGDLGPNFWPYLWGDLADVNALVREAPVQGQAGSGGGSMTASRTTWDAPLRNPVDVLTEYAADVTDKLSRAQMKVALEELAPKLDTNGKRLLSEYMNGVLFKVPGLLDRWAREGLDKDKLLNHPKPGEAFPLDGAWGLDGQLAVKGEAYDSPSRGQTYQVEIDGRAWPVAFSGAELAALKMGGRAQWTTPVSWLVRMTNYGASLRAIAGNLRSFFRQVRGGQARLMGEAALGDFAHGHGKAIDYWRGKLSGQELMMLRDAGVLEGELGLQGVDMRSMLQKTLFSNVYGPDTHTKIAAWFAEWERLGREEPGLSKGERMDAATRFALKVSDLNLDLVQAPVGNTPGAALFGLFNKSRLRELRHLANMSMKNAGKYGAASAAAWIGMQMIGNLNEKEVRTMIWSEIPFAELLAPLFDQPMRHDPAVGAAGLDIPIVYLAEALKMARQTVSDVVGGRSWGSTFGDKVDEFDRRARKVAPLAGAYRTASDLARATLGSDEVARTARASLVTTPQPPHQTEYQRDLASDKRRESGQNNSGGRRGNSRKRLFRH